MYQMRCLPWHVSLFPVLIFSALSGSNDRDNQWPVPQGKNKRDYEILKGWFRLSLGSLACKVYFSLSDENSHQFRQNFAYPFFLKLFQSEISALKKKKVILQLYRICLPPMQTAIIKLSFFIITRLCGPGTIKHLFLSTL